MSERVRDRYGQSHYQAGMSGAATIA